VFRTANRTGCCRCSTATVLGIKDMREKQPDRSTEADANLQREIRAGRKFTLSEAIGRSAGPGMMKGRLQSAASSRP
jgi:hypothetical protein